MKKLLLIALSTFAASANAWEPTFYVGGNFGSSQFTPKLAPPFDSNFTVKSLDGLVGVKLFDFIAIEARLGAGLGEDEETVDTISSTDEDGNGEFDDVIQTRMSAGVDYYGSIYLKPYLANEKASIYALLGYTSVGLDVSDQYLAEDDSFSDLSYGLGVSFKMNQNIDLTFEWKDIINADDFDIVGGTIGFTYSF